MFGVKFVPLLMIITVTVTAVPIKSTTEKYGSQKSNIQQILGGLKLSPKNSVVMGRFQGLMKSTKEYEVEPLAENLNQRSFRLPNNTEPVSYNIRLSTDIHRGHFGFQGDVTINIIAMEATDSITLHSRQTLIERIDLFNSNGTLFQGNVPFTYDSEVEFLVIPVNGGLEADQELTIEISYAGFLRTDLMGFFRTSYIDPDTDEEVWLATTQFQPINARAAFPCYDEVRYRRPITLQIRHHRSYNAISNTAVANLTIDGDYAITVFEETPPIPVFVLAFTVSDFDFVRSEDPDTEIRVYARPSAIAANQADDGLRLGQLMLRRLEDLLNVPYSLSKSDQVAIPSFASDGALNRGLITHREDVILQFNNDTAAQRFREIRVAHEYAHIFFGNLVAPSSWAYLWLNEGIATLYESVLHGFMYPEQNLWLEFLIDKFDTAITIDVMGLVPALNAYVETPQEVRSKFDFVTYNKGAIVVRMFGEAITRETGRKGTSFYLTEKQYENASPDDYYAGMQKAYDEDFPGSGLNFTNLMSPWFDFAGFPVVTVRRSEGGVILSQEGFRTLHNELFPIPINFATASNPDFEDPRAATWMTTSEIEISRDNDYKSFTDDDWLIFNLQDTSYYITNYDDNLWDVIIDALNNEHEAIAFLNRGTLFADFHRFIAQNFDINIIFFLRMMESFPLEFEPHVWMRADLGVDLIEIRLRGTEFHDEYLIFLREIMSQVYDQRSFNDRNAIAAIDVINQWSCLSGVQECWDDALNALVEVIETGGTNFEYEYQCNGLRAADVSVWMDFYNIVLESDSTEDRSDALRDLLCTENEDLLRFYLDQVLNDTNSLLPEEREIILISAAVQHFTSYTLLLEYIEVNSEAINEIVSISNLLLELAMVSNNYINAESVTSLLQFTTDDTVTEEYLAELMQPNLDFVYRNNDALTEWFDI